MGTEQTVITVLSRHPNPRVFMNFMGHAATRWGFRVNLAIKVTAAVFLSIIIIEAVILIPSYLNYERDLLLRLEQVGRASMVSAYMAHEAPSDKELLDIGRAIIRAGEGAG